MSTITATIFAIITDNDQRHSELTKIMRKEYEPFLTRDRATYVNTYKLEQYVHEELLKWYEWLPDTAISQIGGRTGNGSVQACGLEADSFPYSGRTANSRVESAIHDSAYDFPHVASSMNTLDAAGWMKMARVATAFRRMTFTVPFDILGFAPSLHERSSYRCKSGRAQGPSKPHRRITGRSKPNGNSFVGA